MRTRVGKKQGLGGSRYSENEGGRTGMVETAREKVQAWIERNFKQEGVETSKEVF